MKPAVLVAGGAGYIGSHCCKALSRAGFTPVVFDNLSTGHRDAVQWGPFVEGSILDRDALDRALAEYRPVAAMHFAALSLVGESVTMPSKYYRNNVFGLLQLAEAVVAAGIDKIIFSSTCAIYGTPDRLPIDEQTVKAPISPYGHSKLMAEQILQDFDSAHDLKSVCLRYFNACGADADGEIGEDHEPETHLIPRVIYRAMGKNDDLVVFGTDYPTPDGTALRDYIHVEDLAEAHVAALNHLIDGGASSAINVGVGRSYSVLEIIQATERVTGRSFTYEIGPRRAGDPPNLVADATKAQEMLKFSATRSDLDNILKTAWAWHQKRHA